MNTKITESYADRWSSIFDIYGRGLVTGVKQLFILNCGSVARQSLFNKLLVQDHVFPDDRQDANWYNREYGIIHFEYLLLLPYYNWWSLMHSRCIAAVCNNNQDAKNWMTLAEAVSPRCYIVGDYVYHRPGRLRDEELSLDFRTSAVVLYLQQVTTVTDILTCVQKMTGGLCSVIFHLLTLIHFLLIKLIANLQFVMLETHLIFK